MSIKVPNTDSENFKQPDKSGCKQAYAKILITGANGYIGSRLRNFLKDVGYAVYGVTSKKEHEEKIYQLDINDSEKLLRIFGSVKPNVVVHTAALASLSECEKNPELAMKVNVDATRNLIETIRKTDKNVKFVFLSSDYVFDGQRGNYKEDDEVKPQTVYGKTKALAETYIIENLPNYLICRTANVYGRGGNFFNFVSSILQQNNVVKAFADTFYTPTYLDYLLDSIKALIEADFKGVIHIAGPERLSRYEFALKMAETLGKEKSLVQPVKVVDKLIAKDSSLNCEYSRKVLRNYWPSVEESLHYCFGNLVPPYFYYVDHRGKLVGVFQGLKWEEINYIESTNGSVRGNHYHKETREGFFLIDGKIRVTLVDNAKGSKRIFVSKKGDAMVIDPNIMHTFEMLENSRWINMLSKPLESQKKDIHVNLSDADS